MPSKGTPKPDDPEQLKRFREMARVVEVDESEGGFDRAFGRVAGKAKSGGASNRRSSTGSAEKRAKP
jgi:hypothetical protein